MERKSDVKQISQAHLRNMTGTVGDENIPDQSSFDDGGLARVANGVTPAAP
jgi:hypothetical protein